MGVQMTPGQRCLIDLLQRKLLKNMHAYAMLSLENKRQQESGRGPCLDGELQRLKEKIRRISARQKRFTYEIINGNGNNTIPKESFFEALGLVTKEALSKLNSKTNERRRRTTANPRFSHDAIQAKRALEPLQKRLEPRVKDNKRESSRKPQRNNNHHQTNNNNNSNNNNNNNDHVNSANIRSNATSNQQASNNNHNNAGGNTTRASSRASSGRRRKPNINADERKQLLAQTYNLQKQISLMVEETRSKGIQIQDKKDSNKKLERQNELIRKRGLDIISAINMINPNLKFQTDEKLSTTTTVDHQNLATSQKDQLSQSNADPQDIWIDMKCDESLDGLD